MKEAILATLVYTDIFDYPLTEKEIWEWLICQRAYNIQHTTYNKEIFVHLLASAVHSRKISTKKGFYYLKGREKIVALRKKREFWSKEKIERAEKVAGILRLIPWIKLIGITGGLARQNVKEEDDIDLFFIVAQNRLWLTRGLVVLILSILGLYRRPNKTHNMICPNMFVTENALKMEPEDLFIAHEVCLMKPIFEKENTYQRFLMANSWVKKFLPNAIKSKKYNVKSKIGEKRIPQILDFRFYLLDIIERLARDLQLWYMAKKRTTEVVSNSLVKFHPQDARVWILEEFKKRLYGLDKR